MRKDVVKLLRPLHAVAVENAVSAPGFPDVECVLGLLELKSVDRPKRDDSPVRVDHYSKGQRLWHRMRARAVQGNGGGFCLMLLKCDKWWFIIDALLAADHVGDATFAELQALAIQWWCGKPKAADLLLCLRKIYLTVNGFSCGDGGPDFVPDRIVSRKGSRSTPTSNGSAAKPRSLSKSRSKTD